MSRDLEATAGPSSKMHELTKLNKIDESPAHAKLSASDRMQIEGDDNVVAAPPSPRTLLAIQKAMVESSSEEELDAGQLNVDQFVSEAGSMSPRTLQAIQQALSEDDKGEQVVGATADGVLSERPEGKDFLLSSSDEEEQIPEVKEKKPIPTATINSSIQVTMKDAKFKQKSQELEKSHIAPQDTDIFRDEKYSAIENTGKGKEDKEENDSENPIAPKDTSVSIAETYIDNTIEDTEDVDKEENCSKNLISSNDTSISRAENYSYINNTSKDKEDGDKEKNGSKMDLKSLGDKDMNLHLQKSSCSSLQTNIDALIHAETTDLSKNEQNLKISENTEEVISQTEENVSEHNRFFPGERDPEEEREGISQSEDSDSDGMCFF